MTGDLLGIEVIGDVDVCAAACCYYRAFGGADDVGSVEIYRAAGDIKSGK